MHTRFVVSSALAGLLAVAGCTHARTYSADAPRPTIDAPDRTAAEPIARCWTCATIPMDDDLQRAINVRIDALKERGGACATYGAVLDSSIKSGRITVRPVMWRHDGRLVAGEAAPNGDVTLAREIDSLNVGRRGVDEVVWTMEHEAVHIAFAIPSSSSEDEAAVNSRVRNCR